MSAEESTFDAMREAFFRGEIGSDMKPITPLSKQGSEVSFRITGPGFYRTRGDLKAEVERGPTGGKYPWIGRIGYQLASWKDSGAKGDQESCNDLIAPWEKTIIPPSPPPITDPTYRPWTFEEVPIGAEVCWADGTGIVCESGIIVGRTTNTIGTVIVTVSRHDYPAKSLLDSGRLCSINGGPWRRCGVEIPAEPAISGGAA